MNWRMTLPALACMALFAATAYQTEIAQWREQREERLKRDGGWLLWRACSGCMKGRTLSAKTRQRNCATDGAAKAGVFELQRQGDSEMDGASRELWPDSLDVAKVGRLSLFVIKRADRFGIRMKDPDSQYRREFHGIEVYLAKPG
jgi:uncharacterized protein (DUF1684 family)